MSHPSHSLVLLGSEHPRTIAAPATFDFVLQEIAKAREYIEIHMYVWRSDRIGNEVAAAVLAAADRGVHVKIIKDLGALLYERIEMNRKPLFDRPLSWLRRMTNRLIARSFPDTFVEDDFTDEPGRKLLAHPNVNIEWVNKTHTKYYLFDERLLVTGSINIEDRHYHYYDYMLALDDAGIITRFRQRTGGMIPYDPNLPVDFISNSHRTKGPAFEIKPEILRLINEARSSIYVEMAYLGDEEVTAAFIAATKRGVAITFLFSREANIGNDLNYRTIHQIYASAGVDVHLTDTMIHSKLMMIDEQTILTGSANLSVFSMQKSEELNLVIHKHPELVAALKEVITRRLAVSPKVTSAKQLSRYRPLLAALQQWHQRVNPN